MKQGPRRTNGMHFFIAPELPGLEVVRIRDVPCPGNVGLHAHDSLVLAAVHVGARRLRLGAGTGGTASSQKNIDEYVAGPGMCCVVEPGRMHACSWDQGSCADCLCVKSYLLQSLGFDSLPHFDSPILEDARLYELIRDCAVDPGSGALLAKIVVRLKFLTSPPSKTSEMAIGRAAHGNAGQSTGSGKTIPEKCPADARTLLARLEQAVTASDGQLRCNDLAREAGLSPWALSRAFARAYGAPPRDYALHLRVQAAKKRLAQGETPAYVALETGFFDQSHLIRRFRGLVGLTPGQYAAAFGPPPAHAEE